MSPIMPNETERRLRALFAEVAPARPPHDLFETVMAGTEGVRQRPWWRTPSGLGSRSDRRWVGAVTIVALALLALVAGVLLTAGAPPRPRSMPEVELLYTRYPNRGGGLFAMRADGTGSHRLFERDYPGQLTWADWSPDGEQVVFIDDDTRHMVISRLDAPEGSRSVDACETRPGCGEPAWSPDGARIAFIQSGSIRVLDLTTGDVRTVVGEDSSRDVGVPGWSPDGTQLVISVTHHTGLASGPGFAIATVPVAGGELTDLTAAEMRFEAADWSPGGDVIVFSEHPLGETTADSPGARRDLWTVDPDGRNLARLTHASPGILLDFPSWSPDGRWIIARDLGRGIAVRVDPGTGSITPIGGTDVFRPLIRP